MAKGSDEFDRWLKETAEVVVSAGLDPAKWQAMPDRLVEQFPGAKVFFYTQDMAAGYEGSFTANIEQSFLDEYRDYYCHINPWIPFWAGKPCCVAYIADDVMPASSFAKSEFYTDCIRKIGTSATGIKLVDEHGRFTILTVHFGSSASEKYNRSTVRALQLLEPSFKAALSLNRQLAHSKATEAALGAVLAALDLPALILDRNRFVRYANAQALATLELGRLIRTGSTGHVMLADWHNDKSFGQALGRLCRDGETATSDITLANKEGVPEGVISLFPISDGASGTPSANWMFQPERLALVMLRETAKVHTVPAERLRARFGLTAAEARVATRLATGEALDYAAEALGISRETARHQLKAVFSKTQTHRQAELVALLSKL